MGGGEDYKFHLLDVQNFSDNNFFKMNEEGLLGRGRREIIPYILMVFSIH